MIRIVLLDPHPVAQKGFKSFFKKSDHIEVVKTFNTYKSRLMKKLEVDNTSDL